MTDSKKKITLDNLIRTLTNGLIHRAQDFQASPEYYIERKPLVDRLREGAFDAYDTAKQTASAGWNDPRLKYAVGIDLGGLGSYLGIFGGILGVGAAETIDVGYAVVQTAAIHELYGREFEGASKVLTYVVSFLEESMPFALDWIPTATITHFAAAYGRVSERKAEAKKTISVIPYEGS
jgi:hypothetical protein